ncbi:MAG: hypoxanthine phosphoribosyltransferase [Saprospiraceae bacterium]|nr:hypoxanthine phosphoribosyltransferase [Saprospiraceae bacterium]
MKKIINIEDKIFSLLISAEEIRERIPHIVKEIYSEFKEEHTIEAIVLMNGAFMFASDLCIYLDKVKLHFIKASSYSGIQSTEDVKIESYDFAQFKNKNVLLIEDIIETGNTIQKLSSILHVNKVNKIVTASLIVKPNKLQHTIDKLIAGFSISDAFIIGYGMDFNQQGRHLADIYQLV